MHRYEREVDLRFGYMVEVVGEDVDGDYGYDIDDFRIIVPGSAHILQVRIGNVSFRVYNPAEPFRGSGGHDAVTVLLEKATA